MGRRVIRKRTNDGPEGELSEYSKFCKAIREGDILFNMNNANRWGEFLLVVAKIAIVTENIDCYSLVLVGLKKADNDFVPQKYRVHLTPHDALSIPYLRLIGHCEYAMRVMIENVKVNNGLAVIYKEADLRKFSQQQTMLPKKRKYGDDGEPIVRPLSNK